MVKKSNSALFGGVVSAVANSEAGSIPRPRPNSIMEARDRATGPVSRGEVVAKQQLKVDPAICRMWKHHNRKYDLLSEQRCNDLIESYKAQGGQEFPAIVRRISGEPELQYEVITGARRHWTSSWFQKNNHPEYKFLIEVRTLTDEQAFRLSDAENRDREDISEYERALDYKNALEHFYEGVQKKMAQRLEISEQRLGQYLHLADLPMAVVAAYPDVLEIKEYHARQLKPLLMDPRVRARVMQKADELIETQKNLRTKQSKLIGGNEVVRILKAAAQTKQPKEKNILGQYQSASGKEMLRVRRQGRTGLLLELKQNSGASKLEMIEACTKSIEAFYS